MQTPTEKLQLHLQSNKLDLFFDEIQVHLTPDSDLKDLVTLLNGRYTKLKMDIIMAVISKEEEMRQHNTLLKDLNSMLSLADEDDFKAIEIKKSLDYFHSRITAKQNELITITDQRIDGVFRAGASLTKLGNILRGEKDESTSHIPYVELIKSASRKAKRRVAIGCRELVEVKRFQNKAFAELIELYKELVLYMDFPEEEITLPKVQVLKENFNSISTYSKGLTANKAGVIESLSGPLPALIQFLAEEDNIMTSLINTEEDTVELQESFKAVFRNIEAMLEEFQKTIHFFEKDAVNSTKLADELNQLLSELSLSIQENYE